MVAASPWPTTAARQSRTPPSPLARYWRMDDEHPTDDHKTAQADSSSWAGQRAAKASPARCESVIIRGGGIGPHLTECARVRVCFFSFHTAFRNKLASCSMPRTPHRACIDNDASRPPGRIINRCYVCFATRLTFARRDQLDTGYAASRQSTPTKGLRLRQKVSASTAPTASLSPPAAAGRRAPASAHISPLGRLFRHAPSSEG